MNKHPTLRSLAFACSGALLALWPVGAAAHRFEREGRSDLQVGSVREALQAVGYAVSAPMAWDERAIIMEARAPDGVHVVRAFVFSDGRAAAAAHRQANAQQEFINGSVPDSDDAGPQLLSGYGASAWRRNVALVQSSTETFAQLTPAEPDCSGFPPPPGPDLSRPAYRVEPSLVALVESLTGQ
jgi:hypothetical protein